MLSSDREWLTGRAARYEVQAFPLTKINGMHVGLDEWPMRCGLDLFFLIRPDRLASVVIVFDHSNVLQTRGRTAKRQSASSGEEFESAQ